MRCICSGEGRSSAAAVMSSGDDVVLKASGLQKNIEDVSLTANQLTASFFALLAWMVLVTVALLTVVVVGCRRWRIRQRRLRQCDDDDDDDDGDSSLNDAVSSSGVSLPPQTSDFRDSDRATLEGVQIGRRSSSSSRSDGSTINSSTSSSTPGAEP